MQIERAGPDDLGAIERLLVASNLPLDGARDAFAAGIVARQRGEVVGAGAVERVRPGRPAAVGRGRALDAQHGNRRDPRRLERGAGA